MAFYCIFTYGHAEDDLKTHKMTILGEHVEKWWDNYNVALCGHRGDHQPMIPLRGRWPMLHDDIVDSDEDNLFHGWLEVDEIHNFDFSQKMVRHDGTVEDFTWEYFLEGSKDFVEAVYANVPAGTTHIHFHFTA